MTTWEKWESALACAHVDGNASAKGKGYFKLSMLDAAVVKARTMKTPIRPIKLNGMECYVAILHPYQVLDLRRNVSNGQWMDIQKSAMMGGQITNNPIFTGSVGMYNGVIIHEDARIPRIGADNKTSLGADSGAAPASADKTQALAGTTLANYSDITRGVFMGAQSGCIAFGRSYGLSGSNVKFKWTEVLNDYENQLGVSAALVYGCKKSVFDSKDFGTLALSSISTGDPSTIV